jgi:diguanylate cyclase (GGDEF)-like protein/PAS domain S-box-containing protein
MENGAKLEIGYGLGKGEDAFATGVEAARQALSSILESAPSLALVFASVRYDLEELLRGVHSVVGEVPVVGASTSGEICNGPHRESVVVTILASPYLEVAVGVGERVSQGWQQAVARAVSTPALAPFFSPEDSSAWSKLTLQGKSAFALLFAPGETATNYLRSFEILEELKRLSQGRLPIVGGCASDDYRMETNYVFWGGHPYPDSVLLVICQTQLRFGIAMAHGILATAKRAMVTRACDHEVLELDGEPAAEVYCRLQDWPRESLEGKHLTITTKAPMGTLDPYGQYSVSVASFFTPGGGVLFSQPLPEGTVLTLMETNPDSLVTAGREALHKALLRGSITQAAVVLTFSCMLRPLYLGDRIGDETRGMQDLLPNVPITGFFSQGEQGLADDGVSRHNTEAITVLVLGRELSYAAQVALEREGLRREVEQAEALKEAYAALEREVAERQKAEQLRRETDTKLVALVQASPLAIIALDNEGLVRTWNPAATQIFGWSATETLGRLLPIVPEDNLDRFREVVQSVLRGEPLMGFEAVGLRRDGSRLAISVCAAPLLHADGTIAGSVGIIADITERKQTEEKLRQSEERYRTLIENINLGITLIDSDYRIQIMNEAQAKLFNKSAAEFTGKFCFQEFEKREAVCPHCPGARAMATGQPADVETEGVRDDGSRIPVHIYAFPTFTADGQVSGFIEVVENITERRKAQEALENANIQLQALVQEAEARNSTMALLNDMSDMLQTCQTSEEAFAVISHFVPKFFPNDIGALYLLRNSKNLLSSVTTWGDAPPSEELFPPDDCWGIRSGRLHWVDDPAPALLCKHITAADPRAMGYLCVPLVAQGVSLGILHIRFLSYATPSRKAAELAAKPRLAVAIAENLALALANLKLRETLQNQAIRDPLTGLYNRRYLEETMDREIHRSRRLKAPLGVVMMDLDHFKAFNDAFGHGAGDALLSALAHVITAGIRSEDIICRYGGEEFLLVLPGASLKTTWERAENVRQAVKALQVKYQGRFLKSTTISLGVAIFPDHGHTAEEVITAADAALYQAKQAGRDRVEIAVSSPPEASALQSTG